ncbi:MAG: hypothetical protein IJB34_00035 [Clostridia bacterium]|nr:hypothetical protein [Clostridia bacterium]MBQ3505791.1 hypothetical protein [Clostridia bacterium]
MDKRITELKDSLKEKLFELEGILKENDARLDEMSCTEWGGVRGQKVVALTNYLFCAKTTLETVVEHMEQAETYNT